MMPRFELCAIRSHLPSGMSPGMYAKFWLSDSATNSYGGVYIWDDRAAMDDYARSDLFKSVLSHSNFTALTSATSMSSRGPPRSPVDWHWSDCRHRQRIHNGGPGDRHDHLPCSRSAASARVSESGGYPRARNETRS